MTLVTATRFFALAPDEVDQTSESAFYSALKMRNGTFKLTAPSRFDEVEAVIKPFIEARALRIGDVLDIGASTGATTLDLARFLKAAGAAPRIIATDLYVEAHVAQITKWLRVMADGEGWPLQYDVMGAAVRAWVRRMDYFTLAFLPRLLARAVLRPRLEAMIGSGETTPVRMASRRLEAQDIALVENDVFSPTPEFAARFDFVRAANILNLGYFSPERMRSAVGNIRTYCRGRGALFLVVRTTGRRNDGSLFELDGRGRFRLLSRIGGGSEIERLVLDCPMSSTGSS